MKNSIDNCPFCTIHSILEDENFNVFHSIEPESSIHLLIAPKEHMEVISSEYWAKLFVLIEKIKNNYQIPSYSIKMNFNAPRQTIFHSHLHFLADYSNTPIS